MELTKVIITIPKDKYQYIQELEYGNTDYATTRMLYHAVKNGIPLDSVKAEFINSYPTNYAGVPEFGGMFCHFSLRQVLEILDNIVKAESEEKPNETVS